MTNATQVPKPTYAQILEIARREIGVKEIKGPQHNPRILEYHQATKHKNPSDEAAWCSAAACWVHQQAGAPHPNSALAKDWASFGKEIFKPVPGCIVVLKRGDGLFHVGFFVKEVAERIDVLGGNQGDEFKITSFSKKALVSYRGVL
jgi:uncharacterized protein (TIGR02594 family)